MDISPLIASVIATIVISLLSLVGIVFLLVSKKKLNKILLLLVGFSAGTLMGGAFFHLIPEAAEESNWDIVSVGIIIGFILFFLIERILKWHHCHDVEGECDVHTFAYTNLIGDGVHNFIDGMIIVPSFTVDYRLGIITTLAVIMHELPQEISDFGVLIYAGFSKGKALFFNFITALLAVAGAVFGYFLSHQTDSFVNWLLPFAAGGFIYIAASDLVPELHKEKNLKKTILSFLFFILGILFMWFVKLLFE